MQVRRNTANQGRTSRGYVLLVVMAVSVLVITVLGTLAKVSLRRGLEAADAERSLQQRWGALTLERALLTSAPSMFQQREEAAAASTPGVPPPSTFRAALTLHGVTLDLLLGDEDAKVNLNSVYHSAGQGPTEKAISSVLGIGAARSIRLIPAVQPLLIPRERPRNSVNSGEEDRADDVPEAFRSWGEVFDLAALEAQIGSDAALPNLTTGMTCWGSGQLNIRRASDQAILAVVGSVVQDGGAQRLLQRYRDRPQAGLSVLLQTEVASERDRGRLRELLSETSTNFSIWIDASSGVGGSTRIFTVMRRDEEGVTRQSKFAH